MAQCIHLSANCIYTAKPSCSLCTHSHLLQSSCPRNLVESSWLWYKYRCWSQTLICVKSTNCSTAIMLFCDRLRLRRKHRYTNIKTQAWTEFRAVVHSRSAHWKPLQMQCMHVLSIRTSVSQKLPQLWYVNQRRRKQGIRTVLHHICCLMHITPTRWYWHRLYYHHTGRNNALVLIMPSRQLHDVTS